MIVLRFRDKSPREWKVPFNLRLGGSELPLGLGIIATLLFSIAGINLLTKQVTTISGVAFTLVFFVVFEVSERINQRGSAGRGHVELDQFQLHPEHGLSPQTLGIRPGNTLCLVRSSENLTHLAKALELTNVEKRNLVVMTVRIARGPDARYEHLDANRLFSTYEQQLFTQVVALAEKAGKHVDLVVVPSSDVYQTIALAAGQLISREIYVGRSGAMTPEEQAKRMGQAWEHLPRNPRRVVRFRVVERDGRIHDFYLGAHAPSLTAEDIDLIHRLWLDITENAGAEGVHHGDIASVALERLAEELAGPKRDEVLAKFGLGSPKAVASSEGDHPSRRDGPAHQLPSARDVDAPEAGPT